LSGWWFKRPGAGIGGDIPERKQATSRTVKNCLINVNKNIDFEWNKIFNKDLNNINYENITCLSNNSVSEGILGNFNVGKGNSIDYYRFEKEEFWPKESVVADHLREIENATSERVFLEHSFEKSKEERRSGKTFEFVVDKKSHEEENKTVAESNECPNKIPNFKSNIIANFKPILKKKKKYTSPLGESFDEFFKRVNKGKISKYGYQSFSEENMRPLGSIEEEIKLSICNIIEKSAQESKPKIN
jgi:hypothetical protein